MPRSRAPRRALTGNSVALASIRTELEALATQVRLATDHATVSEYAEAMKRGAEFPPVRLVRDGKGGYFLADGWHRVLAAREAKLRTIAAAILPPLEGLEPLGTAVRYALAANVDHGLKLSPGDQRNKARRAFGELPGMKHLSDRKIAQEIGVSHQTVSRARNELVREGRLPHADTGEVADELMPDEYVPRSEFRKAFEGDAGRYHAIRDYLRQLKAHSPRDWRWDAEAQRVIHAGLVPGRTVAFCIEANPITNGRPRDCEPYEDEDMEPLPPPMTDERRELLARIDARKRFDEAKRRLEARNRPALTSAIRTLARYRSVPELWGDICELVQYGGPPQEQSDEF